MAQREKLWLITWKTRRGGQMHVREERSLWRLLLWLGRNIKGTVVLVITRIHDDDINSD